MAKYLYILGPKATKFIKELWLYIPLRKKHSNNNLEKNPYHAYYFKNTLMHLGKNMGWFMNVTCLGSRMNKHSNNHKKILAPPHNLKQAKTGHI